MVNYKEIAQLPPLYGEPNLELVVPVQDDSVADLRTARKMKLGALVSWIAEQLPESPELGQTTNVLDFQQDPDNLNKFIVTYVDGGTLVIEIPESGNTAHGIPAGGTAGQVLAKASDDDFDAEWVDPNTGDGNTGGGGDSDGKWLPNNTTDPDSTGVTNGSSIAVDASSHIDMHGNARIIIKSSGTVEVETSGTIRTKGGGKVDVDNVGLLQAKNWGVVDVNSSGRLSAYNSGSLEVNVAKVKFIQLFENEYSELRELPGNHTGYTVHLSPNLTRGNILAFVSCMEHLPTPFVMEIERKTTDDKFTTKQGWNQLAFKADIPDMPFLTLESGYSLNPNIGGVKELPLEAFGNSQRITVPSLVWEPQNNRVGFMV